MNEKIKAALGFSESEAFDHICYQYRATPMVPTAEVVTNFTAVKDAVTAAIAEAYRLGQERMRERIATHFQTYGLDAQADTIRALPVEE